MCNAVRFHECGRPGACAGKCFFVNKKIVQWAVRIKMAWGRREEGDKQKKKKGVLTLRWDNKSPRTYDISVFKRKMLIYLYPFSLIHSFIHWNQHLHLLKPTFNLALVYMPKLLWVLGTQNSFIPIFMRSQFPRKVEHKDRQAHPDQCGSVGQVSSHNLEGRQFDS